MIAKGEKLAVRDLPDCGTQHSVQLMGELDAALREAGISLRDCDFLACVVGPGSFTGIRIGIATVKGLSSAAEKPVLALTSFDCLAYAEGSGKRLALVDAGHGYFYACPYDGTAVSAPARYLSTEDAEELISEGYLPISQEPLAISCKTVSPVKGLAAAAEALADRAGPASSLRAVYLRKSNAEEGR